MHNRRFHLPTSRRGFVARKGPVLQGQRFTVWLTSAYQLPHSLPAWLVTRPSRFNYNKAKCQ